MAIITKPATINKGVQASFSLSKSELSSHPLVAADDYFCYISNWSKVVVTYKSSAGNQHELVEFDAMELSPSGSFLASDKARDVFEVLHIEIIDFDGGIFVIDRADLNTADFDITLV